MLERLSADAAPHKQAENGLTIIASQALHGFFYACFFAGAYIYVGRLAGTDVRHSAQTVCGIIILGFGPVIAAPFRDMPAKVLINPQGAINYSLLWYTLSAVGLITGIAFALFFRD
ncbi:MAG: hypothetical protein WCK47_09215 [bacterium]|nr:hypothetical protein [Candidatus Sumerlaeota bacterium]